VQQAECQPILLLMGRIQLSQIVAVEVLQVLGLQKHCDTA